MRRAASRPAGAQLPDSRECVHFLVTGPHRPMCSASPSLGILCATRCGSAPPSRRRATSAASPAQQALWRSCHFIEIRVAVPRAAQPITTKAVWIAAVIPRGRVPCRCGHARAGHSLVPHRSLWPAERRKLSRNLHGTIFPETRRPLAGWTLTEGPAGSQPRRSTQLQTRSTQ